MMQWQLSSELLSSKIEEHGSYDFLQHNIAVGLLFYSDESGSGLVEALPAKCPSL